jgi:uncharacterized protein (TIGR03437 family)
MIACRRAGCWSFSAVLILATAANGIAQVPWSPDAFRVLGQKDFTQNTANRAQAEEFYDPEGLALDARSGKLHLYVADTQNHRILAWEDARAVQTGLPATLVLGQPGPGQVKPLGVGPKGLRAPLGVAVDPATGDLYVADSGDSRVLRFKAPFDNPTRTTADAVYGQENFLATDPNPQGISSRSLSGPRALAFDRKGNLWIADTGNNRVLRFPIGTLIGNLPAADIVIGQPDMSSGDPNGGADVNPAGFDGPAGLAFDRDNNLYVSDFRNSRIMKFSVPFTSGEAAGVIIGAGQPRSIPFKGPMGIALDAQNNLYISAGPENRVLMFAIDRVGFDFWSVWGQLDLNSTTPNTGAFPYAARGSMANPTCVALATDGTVFVADSGNNRVLAFPLGSLSPDRVWGQKDFRANGPNEVKPEGLNSPYKIVVDYSQTPSPLYVSDSGNHRVLGWKDSTRFHSGSPPDLVIGQPDLVTAVPNFGSRAPASGSKGSTSKDSLNSPMGIATASDGTLFVADTGNNRILRFPNPIKQTGRILPDAVLGQADFESSDPGAADPSSLVAPIGLAVGSNGDLFVSDTGHNRVLQFARAAQIRAAAVRVFGQPDFTTSNAVGDHFLGLPRGIFVDSLSTVYVADTANGRVAVYADANSSPAVANSPVAFISDLAAPIDVAVGSAGIYVSDAQWNQILQFPPLITLELFNRSPVVALGANFSSAATSTSSRTLSAPAGIYMDRQNTVYVADLGNNRVLHFARPAVAANLALLDPTVPVAPGSLVTLATSVTDADLSASGPLPKSLGGREVLVDDAVGPIMRLAPDRVDFQLPAATPVGTHTVAVRLSNTGEWLAAGMVIVIAASPGLFMTGDGSGQGQVLNADRTANSPANPALRGSIIEISGTGQGDVIPPVADGQLAPEGTVTVATPTADESTCGTSPSSVCVAIGGSLADIQFSGLAAGSAGVWKLRVKVPADTPVQADVPVTAVVRLRPSNTVTIAVK